MGSSSSSSNNNNRRSSQAQNQAASAPPGPGPTSAPTSWPWRTSSTTTGTYYTRDRKVSLRRNVSVVVVFLSRTPIWQNDGSGRFAMVGSSLWGRRRRASQVVWKVLRRRRRGKTTRMHNFVSRKFLLPPSPLSPPLSVASPFRPFTRRHLQQHPHSPPPPLGIRFA